MTDITLHALHRGWHLGFVTGIVPHLNLGERYRRWRQYRTVAAELRQYSGNQLSELGIAEADIETIARDAAAH